MIQLTCQSCGVRLCAKGRSVGKQFRCPKCNTLQTVQGTVRVFLCATYRDMQIEREFLHTFVFPYLQRCLVGQGITLEVVDLGWKSDENHTEGAGNLKQALDEIERCRPFFIALLGNRYGTGLERIPSDARAAYPWLAHCQTGMSRHHLEIMRGVLNDPAKASKSFFYRRSEDFLGRVSLHGQALFAADSPDESAQQGCLYEAILRSRRHISSYSWEWKSPPTIGLPELARCMITDLKAAILERTELEPGTELTDIWSIRVPDQFGSSGFVKPRICYELIDPGER